MRVAPEIVLTPAECAELTALVGSKRAGVGGRCERALCYWLPRGRKTKTWQCRKAGIERDLPGGASPLKIDVTRLIELTPERKAEPAAHWSTRVLSR